MLPEGEPHYPDLQLTDLSQKQWLEEVIREKCFLALDEELPYSIKVDAENIETEGKKRVIEATIYTTADRYKGMIIGRDARKLKDIGIAARKEIETATGDTVYLDLNVKVDPDWPRRFQ